MFDLPMETHGKENRHDKCETTVLCNALILISVSTSVFCLVILPRTLNCSHDDAMELYIIWCALSGFTRHCSSESCDFDMKANRITLKMISDAVAGACSSLEMTFLAKL